MNYPRRDKTTYIDVSWGVVVKCHQTVAYPCFTYIARSTAVGQFAGVFSVYNAVGVDVATV